jgi:MFS family permease
MLSDAWSRAAAGWRGPLVPLLIVVFAVMSGIGMVWSVLAIHAQSLGASTAFVGIMIGSFGAARLVVNLPAGLASERLGRRTVILAGLVILAAGSFLGALAHGIPELMASLLVQGVGSSAYVTAALSAVTDLGTPASRVRDMSAFQGASLIGLSLGPGLGGLEAAAWGYSAPFLFQGGLALVAILALSRVRLGAARAATAPRPAPMAFTAGLLTRLGALALLTFSTFFTRMGVNWVLLPLIAQRDYGRGAGSIGLMLTLGAIANLAVLPFTARAERRFGRKTVLVGSSLVSIGALLLPMLVASDAAVWVCSILIGMGSGLAAPTISAYIADAAPPGRIGAAMGLMRTMSDIGMITGPAVTGSFIDDPTFGQRGGMAACVALLVLSTGLFLCVAPRSERGTPRRPR